MYFLSVLLPTCVCTAVLPGPCRDDIDAFVLQVEGSKRWRLHAPTDPEHVLPRCAPGAGALQSRGYLTAGLLALGCLGLSLATVAPTSHQSASERCAQAMVFFLVLHCTA